MVVMVLISIIVVVVIVVVVNVVVVDNVAAEALYSAYGHVQLIDKTIFEPTRVRRWLRIDSFWLHSCHEKRHSS